MAQGFLQSFDKNIEIHSAGISPAAKVNSRAIEVMAEVGIDISKNSPRSVDEFLNDQWDYVITVCDEANEACPFFPGIVKHRLHLGFDDPSQFSGTEEFVMSEFRRIRDLIKNEFRDFYVKNLKI
jgi:arsenate reductase